MRLFTLSIWVGETGINHSVSERRALSRALRFEKKCCKKLGVFNFEFVGVMLERQQLIERGYGLGSAHAPARRS